MKLASSPLEAQVRLLRILQDGTFERVGSHHALTVDVRLVAATNRDLREMVASGTFREDLWYRIGVFPIWIPPLRERREDVPALAAHFAARTGVRLGGARLVPSASDIELLLAYDWPGNIREFAAVIERAAILGDAKCLRLEAALGQSQPSANETRSSGNRTLPRSRLRRGTRGPPRPGDGTSHRAGAPRMPGADRGTFRCGRAARDQPAHAARPDAKARISTGAAFALANPLRLPAADQSLSARGKRMLFSR